MFQTFQGLGFFFYNQPLCNFSPFLSVFHAEGSCVNLFDDTRCVNVIYNTTSVVVVDSM